MVLRLNAALPKRRGVEDALRRGVAEGRIPAGAKLPSTRELALELGVSRGTVTSAVEDLIADGLLETRPRTGTYVARAEVFAPGPAPVSMTLAPRLDLRPGRPEAGSFPGARWNAALRRATGGVQNAEMVEEDGAGRYELRRELASYLSRARGVDTVAESIVITHGYRSASWILAVALREFGRGTVAIEDPSLDQVFQVWTSAGMRVHDLPVDDAGAQTESLDRGVDAAVLTPAHQFPLGGALDAGRRRGVLEWAGRGGLIVEDDYDGEFRFDRRPVAALQRSRPERVIYAGSVSKTLHPGLRLGWLVLPPELVAPVRAAMLRLTGGVSQLEQLALAELIRSGDYERHVRRQRREYARRRALLHDAAAEAGVQLPGIPAGLHVIVPVPEGGGQSGSPPGVLTIGDCVTHSLARYTRSQRRPDAAVVGFGAPSRAAFEPAIAALIAWLTRR